MRPAQRTGQSLRSPLAHGLILGVIVTSLAGETRLRLPFDVLPGAVYLALLSLPALSDKSGALGDADAQVGAYLGPAYTAPSSLNLVQPGGTDMTFSDIAWEGKPFRPPPYYGYRAIYWPSDRYGVMLDFTHIKAMAMKDRPVQQSGFKDGDHVPAQAPVSATLKRLEFTHGYNLLTLNALRRASMRGPNLIPYAGVGLGVAIPHVEVQRADKPHSTRTYEYQITGPALQLLGGIEWRFGSRLSLFVEYKLTCAMIRGDLVGGGKVTTNLCTHQLPVGLAVHLRARAAAVT
ncbi:MAG TPA: hypothetical protein VFQ31_01160 [Methyloceanibacter sp.]|nr:hypothetical protein [Methyloceanibacter sp.]